MQGSARENFQKTALFPAFLAVRSSVCRRMPEKGATMAKIRLNEDEEIVRTVKEGLKTRGGYCPCRREMNEDTKCMCKEFREQIADPEFEGYCHCMLYYKEKG